MKTGKFLQSSLRLLRLAVLALLLMAGIYAPANAQVSYADSLALVEIYNSTNGSGWTSSTNWLTAPVSTWEGVTVTNGRVTGLSLPFNNLTGSLPFHVGFLQKLAFLELPGNSISGPIPSVIIFLTSLEDLNLSENQFSGPIPPLLGLNLKLQTLNLSFNQLSGQIPSSLALLQKATNINLSVNQLTGSIPLALGFLKNVERLYLNENQLTGTIPHTIGNMEKAVEIYLYNNKLTGTIPSSVSSLDSLVWFNVSNNDLTGNVPAAIATMPNLFHFNISGNEIAGLPNLSAMTSLGQLRVRDNRLTFEDLEPNKPKLASPTFYTPQDSVGTAATVALCVGDTLKLTADFTGSQPNNRYRWFLTPATAVTATSASPVLTIPNVQTSNSGTYFARCTNTVVTGLTIVRRPVQVTVTECAAAAESAMRVYPTPFENETNLFINSEREEDMEVTVHDKDGRVVETLSGLKTNQDLKIGSQLKSGLYYLNAVHGGKKEVIRIIKK